MADEDQRQQRHHYYHPHPARYTDVVIPPFRFASVENDIFRGAYPTLRNFRYLSRLRLRMVLSLTPEPPIADLAKFCQIEGIQLVHIQAEKSTAEVAPFTLSAAARALTLLLADENRPAYLHCLDGGNVTGCLVLLLRKLQLWAPAAQHSEFLRHAGEGGAVPRPVELLAREFAADGVVLGGGAPPRWLWGGRTRVAPPPGLRGLRHAPPLTAAERGEEDSDTGSPSGRSKSKKKKDTSSKNNANVELGNFSEERNDGNDNNDMFLNNNIFFSSSLEALGLEGEPRLRRALAGLGTAAAAERRLAGLLEGLLASAGITSHQDVLEEIEEEHKNSNHGDRGTT